VTIAVFIVNGESYAIRCEDDSPAVVAVRRALKISSNISRPLDDWELRNARGVRIDDLETITNAEYFLTLRVGAGGDTEVWRC